MHLFCAALVIDRPTVMQQREVPTILTQQRRGAVRMHNCRFVSVRCIWTRTALLPATLTVLSTAVLWAWDGMDWCRSKTLPPAHPWSSTFSSAFSALQRMAAG